MKILNGEQLRLADAYTIKNEPIASIDLMERASSKFVEAFTKEHSSGKIYAVVCGTGNNGGDGLAIGRILINLGYNIQTFVIQPKTGSSIDFSINLERLEKLIKINIIRSTADLPDFKKFDLIIDALFGSGLTRPITGLYASVIDKINQSEAEVVAVDIPSGLYIDKQQDDGAIIKAKSSITFQAPKLSFFIPENYKYVGDWEVVGIGLDKEFLDQQNSEYYTTEVEDVIKLLPERKKFDHKGSFGHGQLVGGSYGKMGAITLASKAFMRTGAGLLTVSIPDSGMHIMQTSVPEAMVLPHNGDEVINKIISSEKSICLGIGPGLGQKKETSLALENFLKDNKKPLILDADALNIISADKDLLSLLRKETIITPHLREFDRLAGPSKNNWQRLEKARSFSKKWKIITVLKGANTAVVDQTGKVYFNTSGNPGMATAGSGDVLLGIISSLRTQGLSAIDAAIAGVFIHGHAADLAIQKVSPVSLVASDIIDSLGSVFLEFGR